MTASPPGPDDPASVGPYTVLGLLGSGGMGRVYLASGADGDRVAVKVIRSDLASDDRFRARFRREIDAARSVPARYTARVLAADPDAARPWVATEYVSGPSLDAHVRANGPLRGRALRALAVGLFRALVALGRAGLVHRDLKPSNVLLDGGRPGRPRVVDFGIARAADDTRMTSTGALVGTPAYMAPEQAIGDSEIGTAADVHAVGAMLVFAATGAPPYAGASAPAVLYRKLHGAPDLGATPEPERGWAGRCLERDPHDRPDAAALLAEARRPVRRAVTGAVAAAAVLALVVGAVVVFGGGSAGDGPVAGGQSATAPPAGTGDEVGNGDGAGVVAADASVPGGGAPVTGPPPAPATVDGPVVQLGHRVGPVVAGVGRVYVTDADTGSVTVLDARGQSVGRVDAGRFPDALALSPDGSRLYVTLNANPSRLVAVDTRTLQVAGTADLTPGDPDIVITADVAVTPDGRTVVVTDPRGSRVVALDAATLRPTAERPVDTPIALAVTPDGRRLLVTGATGLPGVRTAVFALPGLSPVATAPGVDDALALAVVPGDGDRAYLATGGRSYSADTALGLRVLDTGDGRVRSVLPAVETAARLVPGAGGRWLYAVDPYVGVAVLDTTNGRVVARIAAPPGESVEDVAVSPDGRALYLAAGRTLRIVTAPG